MAVNLIVTKVAYHMFDAEKLFKHFRNNNVV